MASDIQQTPFIKQLAANGALKPFHIFFNTQSLSTGDFLSCFQSHTHKMKFEGRTPFFFLENMKKFSSKFPPYGSRVVKMNG